MEGFEKLHQVCPKLKSILIEHKQNILKFKRNQTNRDLARFILYESTAPVANDKTLETKVFATSTLLRGRLYAHIRHFLKMKVDTFDQFTHTLTVVGVSFEMKEFELLADLTDEVLKWVERSYNYQESSKTATNPSNSKVKLLEGQSRVQDKDYNRYLNFRNLEEKHRQSSEK